MNQSNVISLRASQAALNGDAVVLQSDGTISKLGHVFGPYLGAEIDATTDTFNVTGHGLSAIGTVKYNAGIGVTCQLATATVRKFGVIDADSFQAIEAAGTAKIDNVAGYAAGTTTSMTTDGSPGNHATTGFAVGDNIWTADGQLVGAATAVGATSVTINTGSLVALVDNQPLWMPGLIVATGGDTHNFISQNLKETAIGVVVHDVDESLSAMPAAVQLFNHGIFVANADGATPISIGDIVGIKDHDAKVYKAGGNAVGFALDALASGTGLIRVISN